MPPDLMKIFFNSTATESAEVFLAHPDARLPSKGTDKSIGYDICSVEDVSLYPGDTKMISTGLIIKPPEGYYIQLCARSGWGKKYGIGMPHGFGLVDPDYCGQEDIIKVILHRACTNGGNPNHNEKPIDSFTSTAGASNLALDIKKGDRIAQLVFQQINSVNLELVNYVPGTNVRGGFGSTGIK